MKPITFENLRRLIGGRRKNKDRNESPFKRSESFKRISIRRNYLENRGGQKGRNPTKRPVAKDDEDLQQQQQSSAPQVIVGPAKTASLPGSPVASSRCTPPAAPLPVPPPVRQIVAPPPPPPPPPQSQPPVERKRQSITPATPPPPPPSTSTSPPVVPQAATAAGSGPIVAAPVIDYGEWIRCIRAEEDLNHLKRSCSPPTPPARYRYHVHKELDDSSRTDSAISLGRIWMDAPMLPPAAPRSLELPGRPAATVGADGDGSQQQPRRAHHSLESALKDKQRDDRPVPSRRFHRYPAAAMAEKTASRSSVASTCSGKDSGFSLSAPGLSDPPRPPKQLFRKKVQRRPAAGNGATTTAVVAGGKPPRRAASPTAPDQLYQVVVARSPLRQLKLDPMMFVPPEKRRTVQRPRQQHHHHTPKPRPVVEIRDYCVPKDARLQRSTNVDDDDDELYNRGRGYARDDYDYGYDDDEQDRLYESISKGCRRRWQESTDDADTEDDDLHHSVHLNHRRDSSNNQQLQYLPLNHQQQQQQRNSAAARNRVKRKKSARRNIKYVVKPVRRAPSAATRKPSVTAKSKSAWIATSTS